MQMRRFDRIRSGLKLVKASDYNKSDKISPIRYFTEYLYKKWQD